MRLWIIIFLLITMYGGIRNELTEIKHMVNEVVCEALEMEETWETATGIN